MDELVLIGPYTGIKAYGCFAIEIDIPGMLVVPSNGNGIVKSRNTLTKWTHLPKRLFSLQTATS